jgi:serine/threonine-protein kinase
MSDIQASQFGRYELLERLGAGGMAEVYRARYTAAPGITKPVVIKRVLGHYAQEPAFVEMFLNEARISVGLSHGNIVQVFDFGQVEGEYFLAMELVDGQPLSALLKKARAEGMTRLPAPLAVAIVIEMCRGLHYAHTRRGEDGEPLGLVHRDISPDNVLLSYEGEVKVSDFGIAKARLAGRPETDAGVVKGKYLYFSPEQAKGEPLDARSDVYAVGVVLYQLLCGRRPVEGSELEVMRRIVEGQLTPARKLNPLLDEGLWEILRKALATSREERYPSAEALHLALSEWLGTRAPLFPAHARKNLLAWLFREELAAQRRAPTLPPDFEQWVRRWQGELPPPPETVPWEVAALPADLPLPAPRRRMTPWPVQGTAAPVLRSPPQRLGERSWVRDPSVHRSMHTAALAALGLFILVLLVGWRISVVRRQQQVKLSQVARNASAAIDTVPEVQAVSLDAAGVPARTVLRGRRHSFNPAQSGGQWIALHPEVVYKVWTEGEYRPAVPPSLEAERDVVPDSGCLLLLAEGQGLPAEERLRVVSGLGQLLTGVSRVKAFSLQGEGWPVGDEGTVSLWFEGMSSSGVSVQFNALVGLETASIKAGPSTFFTVTGLDPSRRYAVGIHPRKDKAPGPVAMLLSSTRRDVLVVGRGETHTERMEILQPGSYQVAGAQELRFTLLRVADGLDTEMEVEVDEERRR